MCSRSFNVHRVGDKFLVLFKSESSFSRKSCCRWLSFRIEQATYGFMRMETFFRYVNEMLPLRIESLRRVIPSGIEINSFNFCFRCMTAFICQASALNEVLWLLSFLFAPSGGRRRLASASFVYFADFNVSTLSRIEYISLKHHEPESWVYANFNGCAPKH